MNQPLNPNPYQAPQSTAETPSTQIDQLAVSDTWKKRFHLIEKAGGVKLPRFKELSFRERMSVNFNVWAFLFGPIYLLIKGMWKFALAWLGVTLLVGILLGVIESLFQINTGNAAGVGVAAGLSMLANRNYYKKMVQGRLDWF